MSSTQTVSALSIAMMAVSGCLSLAVPAALFLAARKRYRARPFPLLIGAATFALFVLLLERLVITALLSRPAIQSFLTSRWWIYALFGGLMAGFFEETGRLCAFYFLLRRRHNSLGGALAYGAGHGGLEAAALCALAMLNNLIVSVMLNSGGIGFLAAVFPGWESAAAALSGAPPTLFLAAGVERVIAVAFHMAASVLVWMAATGRGPWGLYFLTILLHAAVNFPAGMYQTGVLKNVWLVEGITALPVLVICLATAAAYDKCSQTYTSLLQYEPTDFGLK